MEDTQKTDLAKMEEFLAKAVEAGDQVVVLAAGEAGISMSMSSNCLGKVKDVVKTFYHSLDTYQAKKRC